MASTTLTVHLFKKYILLNTRNGHGNGSTTKLQQVMKDDSNRWNITGNFSCVNVLLMLYFLKYPLIQKNSVGITGTSPYD